MQNSHCVPNCYWSLQPFWSFKGADSERTHSGITTSTQTFPSAPSYSWQALGADRPRSFPDIHMTSYSWKTKLFNKSSLKRQKALDMPELSSSLISSRPWDLGDSTQSHGMPLSLHCVLWAWRTLTFTQVISPCLSWDFWYSVSSSCMQTLLCYCHSRIETRLN